MEFLERMVWVGVEVWKCWMDGENFISWENEGKKQLSPAWKPKPSLPGSRDFRVLKLKRKERTGEGPWCPPPAQNEKGRSSTAPGSLLLWCKCQPRANSITRAHGGWIGTKCAEHRKDTLSLPAMQRCDSFLDPGWLPEVYRQALSQSQAGWNLRLRVNIAPAINPSWKRENIGAKSQRLSLVTQKVIVVFLITQREIGTKKVCIVNCHPALLDETQVIHTIRYHLCG